MLMKRRVFSSDFCFSVFLSNLMKSKYIQFFTTIKLQKEPVNEFVYQFDSVLKRGKNYCLLAVLEECKRIAKEKKL